MGQSLYHVIGDEKQSSTSPKLDLLQFFLSFIKILVVFYFNNNFVTVQHCLLSFPSPHTLCLMLSSRLKKKASQMKMKGHGYEDEGTWV
jgi:hypothetical protein